MPRNRDIQGEEQAAGEVNNPEVNREEINNGFVWQYLNNDRPIEIIDQFEALPLEPEIARNNGNGIYEQLANLEGRGVHYNIGADAFRWAVNVEPAIPPAPREEPLVVRAIEEDERLNDFDENEDLREAIREAVIHLENPEYAGWETDNIYIENEEWHHIHIRWLTAFRFRTFGIYCGELCYAKNVDNNTNCIIWKGDTPKSFRRNGVVPLPDRRAPQINQNNPFPQVKRSIPVRKKKVDLKKDMPKFYEYLGYKFSKPLNGNHKSVVKYEGYDYFIMFNPSYLYEEKVIVTNKTEEQVINIYELANFYALEELQAKIKGFDITIHEKEYDACIKQHIKNIRKFKQNNNG